MGEVSVRRQESLQLVGPDVPSSRIFTQRRITRPSRLVFTEIFEEFPESISVVTAEFTDEGGKTRLTATVRYPSREVRDMVLGTGMARGAGISYDRLEDLVSEMQRS